MVWSTLRMSNPNLQTAAPILGQLTHDKMFKAGGKAKDYSSLFKTSSKLTTGSSAIALFLIIMSTFMAHANADIDFGIRKGLRHGQNLKTNPVSKLSHLLNQLGDSSFCSVICDEICNSLDSHNCTGICNQKCMSIDSDYVKPSIEQRQQVHNHKTRELFTGGTCYPSGVRSIRVQSNTMEQIQMFELAALSSSGSDVASNANAKAEQSSTYKNNTAKFGAFNAIDRDYSSFSHTEDDSAYWEVDLGNDYEIKEIAIANRYCQVSAESDTSGCLCRMTNATISLFDSQGYVVSSIDTGDTCGVFSLEKDFSHANRLAKKMILQSTTGEPINLFEFQAYSSGVNVALEALAIQSSTYQGNEKFSASNALDGSNETFSHTGNGDMNPVLEVIFDDNYIIDDVVIINRWCRDVSDSKGCLCRLSSSVLTILDENDETIATKTLGNTCNKLTLEESFTTCQSPSPSSSPSFSTSKKPSTSPTTSPSFSPSQDICGILESCHDEDLCTTDTTEYKNNQWTCKFVDVDCGYGWRCDGSNGMCKKNWNQTQTQTKIIPNDGERSDYFRSSVCVFQDVIAVGAKRSKDNGATYVFEKNHTSGDWEQVATLTANDGGGGDSFGSSIDCSSRMIVIGALKHSSSSGAAYVFEKNETSGDWQQMSKLSDLDGVQNDKFGSGVAVSGNNLIAVGAPGDNDAGSVFIFERNETSGQWEQKSKLQGYRNEGNFGYSLSASEDIIVIGAYKDLNGGGNNTGAAYVVEKNETSGEWEQTAKLVANDGAALDYFGHSVATSGDSASKVAVVGAYGDGDKGSASGSVYIFEKNEFTGEWQQSVKLMANDGKDKSHYGNTVDMSGNVIVVGAPTHDIGEEEESGSVYIIEKNESSGDWEQTAKLSADDYECSDEFGTSVSVSGDVVVVGSAYDDVNGIVSMGSAYIF